MANHIGEQFEYYLEVSAECNVDCFASLCDAIEQGRVVQTRIPSGLESEERSGQTTE